MTDGTRKASVWWLLPSVALGAIAMGLLTPVMPGLKASWFKGTCPTEIDPNCFLKRAQQISGILSSIRYLIVFAVSAFLGRLSDKVGRIPILRMSNLGSLLPVLALYFTEGKSAWAYYSTFVLSGFISGGHFQVIAYVADCTPVEDRARHFGYLGAMTGIALIVTPLVNAFAESLPYKVLFLVSAILSVVNGLYIEFVLPESHIRPSASVQPETSTDQSTGTNTQLEASTQQSTDGAISRNESVFEFWKHAIELIKENRVVAWLSAYAFLNALPEGGCSEIVPLYLSDVLGLDEVASRQFLAVYFSATGFGIFLAQSLLIWLFMKRLKIGPIGLMLIATLANILHLFGYASLAYNHSLKVAFSNIAITTFMFVGSPATNAIVSSEVGPSRQGLALGTIDSVKSLVSGFGPALFSFLYAFFGERHGVPQTPFIFGGLFASIALLIIIGPLWSTGSPKPDTVQVNASNTDIIEPLLASEGIA